MFNIIVTFLFSFFVVSSAFAGSLDSFLKHLKSVDTLEIRFGQITVLDAELGEKDIYEGVILYKRPEKFKWLYTKNSQMEIVSDGKYVYTCIPEEKKVVKNSLKDGIDYLPVIRIIESPASFYNYFKVTAETELNNKIAYELKPKRKDLTYRKVLLIIDKNGNRPLSFNVVNEDGSEVTYVMNEWKENVKLPDTSFTIKRCDLRNSEAE